MNNSILSIPSWWSQTSPEIRTITLVVATLAALWWVFSRPRNRSPPLPPGPRGLPLIGYLPFLGTDLHRSFAALASTYGPIFKLWLGYKLCVVVSSPSLVKQVVRDHDVAFSHRDPPVAAFVITYGGADMAFADHGPYWRKMRKIFVREMLSNANLSACYHLRRQEVHKSLKSVYQKIGTPVDVGKLMFVTATSAVISMLVGGSGGAENGGVDSNELREVVGETMVLLGRPNVSDLFPILARFDLQGIEKQAKKVTRGCEQIINSVIEQRAKLGSGNGQESTKKDFLQILLEFRDSEDSEKSITSTQLQGLLKDIVIGGTDTTATMAEWVMSQLMKNPKIMKKVQQELTEVVGKNDVVEESHLPNLRYLDAVIKETFRLHPALPLLVPRCPNQPCVVGGYTVPAGSKVFLNIWAIHRDPTIWDNPLEFRPERFLEDSLNADFAGNNFAYLPFGSGRRVCAGLSLADRLLPFILASFLHSFEWSLPEGEELELSDKFGIVMKKSKPLVAVPIPRIPNLDRCL